MGLMLMNSRTIRNDLARTAVAALTTALLLSCTDVGETPPFRPGRLIHDTSPIAVTAFAREAAVQTHVLGMSFGEVAQRLGPMTFNADSRLRFARGRGTVEENTLYHIRHDANGDFHVKQSTRNNAVEIYEVGQHIYVRQDKGKLRKKPRREIESGAWADRGLSGLSQALQLFQPHVGFTDGQATQESGRAAIRFALTFLDGANDGSNANRLAPMRNSAFTPHSRWREMKKPLSLEGYVTIDSETGVIVASKVSGRIEVEDREIRPTAFTLSYESSVTDIGNTAAITVPEHVEEFRRTRPPHNLLDFFADHLPAPKEDAKP